MVDLFDEVGEELRAERARLLFKRYAGLIIAALLLVVAAAGGWELWRWRQSKEDQAAAKQYLAAIALQSGPSVAAERKPLIAEFDAIAKASPDGYKTLTRLQAAALEAQGGDLKAATALWEQVASDDDADPLLRNLANLLWCEHQIDAGNPAVLAGRLKALAAPDSPWRPLAEEQLALLDLRQKDTAAAKTTLTNLMHDDTAPTGVRERAAALLARLG